jgi:gluconolactonase
LATSYMNARFNSPNDLAIRSDGNIYFSDPTYQAPSSRPQTMTRAYRRAPDGTVTALVDSLGNPNGVTLSLDEDFLYVAASSGKRFALMADGSAGPAQDYAPASGADGMVIDCAGNLYVAKSRAVEVYDPMGNSIGAISVSDVQSVTNLAFGGADRKTLYITGLGNNKGLFKVSLDIPGRPY